MQNIEKILVEMEDDGWGLRIESTTADMMGNTWQASIVYDSGDWCDLYGNRLLVRGKTMQDAIAALDKLIVEAKWK